MEQSQGQTLLNLLENFETFLANKKEWEEANQQILAKRSVAIRKPFPAMDSLVCCCS